MGLRRFYRKAEAVESEGGRYTIALDGRPVRTPAKRPFDLPTRALAEAIAAEWADQGEEVRPAAMPLMGFASTAIDRVAPDRERVIDETVAYGAADLLCYRADAPAELAERQHLAWQPLLDWCAARYQAWLQVTAGVMAVPQAEESLAALRAEVAGQDDFALTALHNLAVACGSLVLALAVAEGRIDAATAWSLSRLDEDWQAGIWGEDPEAARRAAALKAEIEATTRFLELSRG